MTEHQQQPDAYSDEQGHSQRKPKIRPLNLTKQQLEERLLTLKDYSMWKKTKAKRINCKSLEGDQSSPIIHAAASYGYRHGHNEVFAEFVKNQQDKIHTEKEQGKKRYQSQDKNEKQQKQKGHKKNQPSFINYKTGQKEKQKIYKMINQTPIKQRDSLVSARKKRAATEPKLPNDTSTKKKAAPYPKQLSNLKRKLKILPSLLNKNKSLPTQYNPQEDNPTLSLVSNSNQESQAVRVDYPIKCKSSFQIDRSFEEQPKNRSTYLKSIHSILNKSSQLLSGLEKNNSTEADYIRMSNNSYVSAGNRSKRAQSDYLKPSQRQRYLSFWPIYSHYGISDRDQTKFQQILKKCTQINTETTTHNEDLNQMVTIIKDQIAIQQSQINAQVLQEQKNAFEHKFDYKINLQREKYKRNMKELLRCKKEYRIEKQREEIRANGIKRMKKMGDVIVKMQKIEVKSAEKEDE